VGPIVRLIVHSRFQKGGIGVDEMLRLSEDAPRHVPIVVEHQLKVIDKLRGSLDKLAVLLTFRHGAHLLVFARVYPAASTNRSISHTPACTAPQRVGGLT